MSTETDPTHHSLVAGEPLPGTGGTTRATDPATNTPSGPEFTLLGDDQVATATQAASDAFPTYRAITPAARAEFLATTAERIDDAGDDIVVTAMRETGLPEARLRGELARTVNQLRLFARVARTGDHHGVRIEPALPQRTPLPRPDLRQRQVPLGPVAVFGASNFPLAFSVAGGDTASALAAGCPVVVKAHNAHPATSLLVAHAVSTAVAEHDLPAGVFSLIYGRGADVGQTLVADPRVAAVGFTGSRGGGTALMATAAARPVPIPVYAEMSSVNPVFVLPSAVADDRAGLAQGFVISLNGSAGQLCTAPGLLFVPEGADGDDLVDQVATALADTDGLTMLTPGIRSARTVGERRLAAVDGVTEIGRGRDGATENAPAPAVYSTDADTFTTTAELSEEVFGAVCLVVRYRSLGELASVAATIEGQLTATLWFDTDVEADRDDVRRLLDALELRAGRILVNGWPTGVDVGDAIVHGGPFPATSDGRSTSVGTLAIERFLRPVVYQNLPAPLRPAPVQEDNPWNLTRRVDGTHVVAERSENT
ncbi:aldehyde dehydrogenase (NADP(+)) [Spiractinospora alimapuensis]|uniref:aldehyde dehydrogenase (NADP(+)) n=1 Tax=Spiractinospora alimapuensis TaxID=2820884 RepID=UPI001F34AECA|nr:aldehyde dehydrogenase (NADP(+)) [Spiractinospora alimapuensis]QVQ51876.1 aldehyde dehydrogenase (NADP(+)) [Spiractinospora alimapuensis]